MPRIISASRRTDIPSFHAAWFMSRIRDGAAGCINPYGGAKYTIPLTPRDVTAFVFWSKNYEPFLNHLDELDSYGYKSCFHFTITGYGELFEPGVPSWMDAVEQAVLLARRYSPAHVLWRFDPIILSTATPAARIVENFTALSDALEGTVQRCYFSFVQHYGKVLRNFTDFHRETGIRFRASAGEFDKISSSHPGAHEAFIFDLEAGEKISIAKQLARIAAARGISMHTCCGDYLLAAGDEIHKAHCIDASLIAQITGKDPAVKLKPSREQCGCHESVDIGAYDTCPHGCIYCYANANQRTAINKHEALKPGERYNFALKPDTQRNDFPQPAGNEQIELFDDNSQVPEQD